MESAAICICEACGSPFANLSGLRSQCERCFDRQQSCIQACSHNRKTAGKRLFRGCRVCGRAFLELSRGARRTTCSINCCTLLRSVTISQSRSKSTKRRRFFCAECKREFRPMRGSRRKNIWCGKKCYGKHVSRTKLLNRDQANFWRRAAELSARAVISAARMSLLSRQLRCTACGIAIDDPGLHKRKLCCECRIEVESLRSAAAAANRRRLAKTNKRWRRRIYSAGDMIDKRRLFEHSFWRCNWCGIKTNPQLDYQHGDYPTVDHLIPLSCGGSHTWTNVLCACRRCNTERSTKLVGFIPTRQVTTCFDTQDRW